MTGIHVQCAVCVNDTDLCNREYAVCVSASMYVLYVYNKCVYYMPVCKNACLTRLYSMLLGIIKNHKLMSADIMLNMCGMVLAMCCSCSIDSFLRDWCLVHCALRLIVTAGRQASDVQYFFEIIRQITDIAAGISVFWFIVGRVRYSISQGTHSVCHT